MKLRHFIITALGTASLLTFSVLANSASSTATSASTSSAGWHHHEGGDREHGEKPRFDQLLNLTDAQKKTLKDARAQQEPAEHELHEKIRAAHDAIEKAVEANADDAAIAVLANDLAQLIAQQEVNRAKAHQFFLSVLTPEQKQKLSAWEANHPHGFPEPHKFHPK